MDHDDLGFDVPGVEDAENAGERIENSEKTTRNRKRPNEENKDMEVQITEDVEMKMADADGGDHVGDEVNDDDDDPVVKEIEVYLNRITNPGATAADTDYTGASIHLLQYPLRPIYRPYGDQGRLVRVRHRRHQKTLQLQYALNMESEHFDAQFRAELMEKQMMADDKDMAASSGALGGCIPHILNSAPFVSPNSSYGLGLLQGNRLYITPLTSVQQFRPDFGHVDEEENRARKRAEDQLTSSRAFETTEDTSPSAAASKAKRGRKSAPAVMTTTGKNPETGRSGTGTKDTGSKMGEQAHASPSVDGSCAASGSASVNRQVIPPESEWHRFFPSRIRDFLLAELWDTVGTFYDPDSIETHEILQLLTSFEVPASPAAKKESSKEDASDKALLSRCGLNPPSGMEDDTDDGPQFKRVSGGPLVPTIEFSPDYQSYLDRLCSVGGASEQLSSESATSSASGPAASGVLSFLSLSRIPVDQQVLRILQHRHVESFTRIKSLVTKRIPDDDLILHLRSYGEVILGNWVCKSALIYDGLVAHCRDLLLCLLAMEKPIHREKVKPYVGNLSMEKLSEILRELAEYRNNVWSFKLPPDKEFITRYPKLCQDSQERFNKDSVRSLYEKITLISNAQKQIISSEGRDDKNRSSSSSLGGVEALGLVDAECLNKAMQEAMKVGGCQLAQSILPVVQQHLERQAADLDPQAKRAALNGAARLTAEDVTMILPRIAEDVGCGYWALRSTGSGQIDRHRAVILSMFKRQTLEPSENLKGITKPAVLAEFTARSVKFDLPDFTFRKLMKEFAVNQEGFWVFKGFLDKKAKP